MEDVVYPFDEDEDEDGSTGAAGGGMLHSPAQIPQDQRRRHGTGITIKE
jgi:hypothetical protein